MSESAIIIGGAVATVGKLAYDVLGPTAQYLGTEMRGLAQVGVDNLNAVFRVADRRLKLNEGRDEGIVPPRVLKAVLDEGYFCEDPLQREYLGGILASSRSGFYEDDRGASFADLLSGLSTFQIRTHYLCYSAILRISDLEPEVVGQWIFRHGLTLMISEEDYRVSMGIADRDDAAGIGSHAFTGLNAKNLIEEGTRIIKSAPRPRDYGNFRFYRPTQAGVELFLWGLGLGLSGFEVYHPDLLSILPEEPQITPINSELGAVSYG